MNSFNLVDGRFEPYNIPYLGEPVLPTDGILLQRTPITIDSNNQNSWDIFWEACRTLKQQISTPKYIFVDAAWDPVKINNEQIHLARERLEKIFVGSKICILSAAARHYYDDLPGCVYFPLFLMIDYPDLQFRPRSGRIGCLNRRNAGHRVWLMHHLLDQQLIDSSRDIYSVSFTSLYTNNYWDLGIDWFNEAQQKWPTQIATHPDGFLNDYSIDHPAWHTGIAVITETEPGEDTIICEKTAKGILSKSCFSIYMSETGYRVLEDLGFRPRFFDNHAQDLDIQPIIDICKTITTESQALEYRQQHMDKIQHNFDWFAFKIGGFQSRPWWTKYEPKLRQVLDNL